MNSASQASAIKAGETEVYSIGYNLNALGPRFLSWMDAERDNIRTRQHIARAAEERCEADDDPDLLWRGAQLTAAQEWADKNPTKLNDFEVVFIE